MTMVSRIGGAPPVQSLPVQREGRTTQEMAAASVASDEQPAADAAGVRSAQTEATARLGEQLDAQFDAGRVQPAQEDTPAENGADASAAEATGAGAAAPPAAGAAAASSESASTDYIAEADTNNDRKLSEQERIAYEKKQAGDAEKASRAREVQQDYLPQESAGAQLDIEA